uniref:Uncharacterized protein n=1 Tax=Chromera velia CCMP2878 TaxID=1169474 RepID=A0A0G4HV59_9ALVE|eukprot:Cvel_8744.t1-p1 / transcript=Cvel_8744.t1 / gene=Cvel_8744 / organism=Chromera_velia_CCMP2878 / gene_product=hypothetical protein / transcript_product=hypothetical protein / location=Cvel_scaffold489:26458-27012(+) / protein_length=185 / sequence_SO=supercontig / SO=protein_coding / is_pseudo=false
MSLPQENHQRDQYFFAPPTREFLREFVQGYQSPCLLFMPSMASELPAVRCLDIDDRFEGISPGFRLFDAYRPARPADDPPYDIIIADPPFDKLRVDQLYKCMRELGMTEEGGPRLLLSYPLRREEALLASFPSLRPMPDEFNLPQYCSVNLKRKTEEGDQEEGSRIRWYANFAPDEQERQLPERL